MPRLKLVLDDLEFDLPADGSAQLFEWTTEDGAVHIFDVQRFDQIVQRHPHVYRLTLAEIATSPAEFLQRCDLDLPHAATMTAERAQEPISVLLWDGGFIIIDGNHRVFRALCYQQSYILAHIVEDPDEVCQVHVVSLTADQAARLRNPKFVKQLTPG